MFGLYSRLIAAAMVLALLGGVYWRGHTQGAKAVKLEWQADIAQRTADALQAEQAARAKESELQGKAAVIRRTKDAQIHSLGLELSESLQRLRNRPERPAAGVVPPVAGSGGGGCTGAELFQSDAAAFTRLAAEADRVRIGLEACQSAYRAGREALKP